MEKLEHIKIMDQKPLKALSDFTRKVAGETVLLLKNDHHALPISHKRVAVFGRIQSHYYKSGTGSGGLVNVDKVPSIIESFKTHPLIQLDEFVYEHYQTWLKDHPYDAGNGQWASEPWAQVEYDIPESIVEKSSKVNDVAVVIFGRTAGEDKDAFYGKGSYLLSDLEDELLQKVTKHFKSVVVVLNIGNIMDLGFMDTYPIDGLVVAWHGGMYGAHALLDCLTGLISPSAKLPMTIVKDIKDIPSHEQFGLEKRSFYTEDIYVGYRYFETFNKNAVRYPFGYGLTYTTFKMQQQSFNYNETTVNLSIKVTNTGTYRAKEVVQIYIKIPQGKLGKPDKILAAFKKTVSLKPQDSEILTFNLDLKNYASYDDVGYIQKSSYILEKGSYIIYVGSDVKTNDPIGKIDINEDIIVETLSENMAPEVPFKRMKPTPKLDITWEDVPLRSTNYMERIEKERIEPIQPTNKDFNLLDVYQQKIDLDTFVSSLSVEDMIHMSRGEGMSSPKVTPGTAAAFGGVTEKLIHLGIPLACAADGPSGIRMDSGAYASSLPSATALASSFNINLTENLYYLLGLEMKGYHIDTLLGPGMNIQRHPLNGRNFEYFSEDPLLTGLMATAFIKGLHRAGVDGSLKHFVCNNQETDRFNVDAIVSERALREIYLKGFEIAVKQADAQVIMTSYNPINGIWAASNYELNKRILRDEWGFNGLVITDWWAKMNDYHRPASRQNTKAMIQSQNDLYMVVEDSLNNSLEDNSLSAFNAGKLTLSQLQITTKHILNYILKTPAFFRHHQLNIKHYPYDYNNLFSVNSNLKPNFTDAISINTNDGMVKIDIFNNHLSLENKTIETLNKPWLRHEHNLRSIYLKDNQTDVSVYEIYQKEKLINSNIQRNIVEDKLIAVGKNHWDQANLNFKQIIQHSKEVDITRTIDILGAQATFDFGLLTLSKGKYIFEVTLKVDAKELAQVPFSIFINDEHQATLTLRNTQNQYIQTKAFIILDSGKHYVQFKMSQGGISIQKIAIIKHG